MAGLLVAGTAVAWVLALRANREAEAAQNALNQRDQAVERQKAIVRAFVVHLGRYHNLSEQNKQEVLESFFAKHPEYGSKDLYDSMLPTKDFAEAPSAGTAPPAMAPTHFGD